MPDPVMVPVPGLPPGVHAVFSTRVGGMSEGSCASLNLGITGGDASDAVRANRVALATACGFDAVRAVTMTQVHGADVIEVGPDGGAGNFTGTLAGIAEADCVVTTAPGVALLAQGADCVPVVLWRTDAAGISAAHAGWRGLVAGVLGNAVRALGAGQIGAAIGPCVGPCCYPVESALRERMSAQFGHDVVVGEAVDLRRACRRSLLAAGAEEDLIVDIPGCTSCDDTRFFSYRRDGERTGRQAGVIWLADR